MQFKGYVQVKTGSCKCIKIVLFLVACTRLYKPLCRTVGRSVGPSVRRCSRSTRLMAIGLVRIFCPWLKFILVFISMAVSPLEFLAARVCKRMNVFIV